MTAYLSNEPGRRPATIHSLQAKLAGGEPIAALTCYDATFARLLDDAGVDCILVGDSLGNVVQGHRTTLPVGVDDIAYHTACVARGLKAAWLIADLPFGSYHEDMAQAIRSSVRLMQAGAQMIKLEGGGWTVEAVHLLTQRGIPVCGHLGLIPQSVNALGGYRVQGRDEVAAGRLLDEAKQLAEAGITMLVLELVPQELAAAVQRALPHLITIGIGAGANTAGQILVLHDMLGTTVGKAPKFVRNFVEGGRDIPQALRAYVEAVKTRAFPAPEHCY
jgi:3-methyl-2-oxobutanoate hydroxymethyltransferase